MTYELIPLAEQDPVASETSEYRLTHYRVYDEDGFAFNLLDEIPRGSDTGKRHGPPDREVSWNGWHGVSVEGSGHLARRPDRGRGPQGNGSESGGDDIRGLRNGNPRVRRIRRNCGGPGMTRLVLRSISCLRLWPALILATSAMARDDVPRSRTFELSCRMTVRTIPQNAKTLDIWVPFPQTDPNQTIHQVLIDAPGPVVLGRESRFGNQSVHLRIDRPTQPATLTLTITATRRENPGRNEPLIGVDRERALAPEPLVPLSGPIRGARGGRHEGPGLRSREGPGDLRQGFRHDEL